MLKVMLVDDEPFITQGLKVLIDWEKEGFEIVKIANDGEEAYDYLKENELDLIISDIKMPGMTGIELLEKVREEKISDAYFVILSGYSDFSYTQKAIWYNCMDYVLKPVNKADLISVLKKVSESSEQDKLQKLHSNKTEKAYLERYLTSVVLGKFDKNDIEYVESQMDLSWNLRYVSIFIDDENAEIEDKDLRERQKKLYNACLDVLKDYSNNIIFDNADENSYAIGFIYCDYMSNGYNSKFDLFLEYVRKHLEGLLQKRVMMVVGKNVNGTENLCQSYGSVNILRSQLAFHDKKEIYIYDIEFNKNQSGEMLCKNSLDKLILAIEQNDEKGMKNSVDAFYEEIRKSGRSKDAINLNINYLLFQLIHIATKQDNNVNQEEILSYISEQSFNDNFSRGSSEHLLEFSKNYAIYLQQLRKTTVGDVFTQVEELVKEHYAENLNLVEISKRFYINNSYFGRIFYKKYGITFKDYLTVHRVNVACNLLLTTDMRVADIGEAVGYKDRDYFIKKFIEKKGCTPTKYRKSHVQ